MFKIVFFCGILFCSMFSKLISATPQQEGEAQFLETMANCMTDNAMTEDDINKLKELGSPTGPNTACFMACVVKQFGAMDDSGMIRSNIDADKVKPIVSDPEGLKKLDGYLTTCSYVNNESVTDGEKGCERAVLFYTCMMDNNMKLFKF